MTVAAAGSSQASPLRVAVRWGLYPVSWAITLGSFHILHNSGIDPRRIWAATIGVLAALYLVVEIALPYESRWSMTWRSLYADLKFAALNTLVVVGLSAFLALFAISIAGRTDGPVSNWPEPMQLLVALLIFEAINYSIHRAMHEARGRFGRFLWYSHAAHHLPPRLYLVMHAVFHPLNGLAIQGLAIILPIWLMGYTEPVVVMFLIINGMHGLISHFNVDIRMGWANYLFIGPELHRYHHSADVNEAKNYGATIPLYDLLFGTFVYHPGVPPKQLGVNPKTGMPSYERTFAVLALPFAAAKKR